MKTLIINAGRGLLNAIYALMKRRLLQNKVVFISRQGNEPSVDFVMLSEELNRRGVETQILCKTLDGGVAGAIGYGFHMLRQMHAMATSRAVVLDTYCIAASLLKHRENLEIVQMWHALGAMKKFGLSILDMPEGKKSSIAIPMRMHQGYTQVLTSSEASRAGFAEAFGYPPEMLTIMSLPRVDAILDEERDAALRERIKKRYPKLENGRKTILYVPTHRMNGDMRPAIQALMESAREFGYNFIVKVHPLTKLDDSSEGPIIVDHNFDSIDVLAACDYVITDYSAITYEAALKGRPLFFYAYDKEEYLSGRTFYLDYEQDMPGPICEEADAVLEAIRTCDEEECRARVKAFANKYVEKQQNCTLEMADFIMQLMN